MLESFIYFSVSIADCKYTCHRRCRDDVDLDCTGGWQFERNLSVDEMTMKTLHLIDQVMLLGTGHVWSWVIMISLKMQGCLLSDSIIWTSSPDHHHHHIRVVFVVGFCPSSEGFFWVLLRTSL